MLKPRLAGLATAALALTFPFAAVAEPPATFDLSVAPGASFGAFVPGVSADYTSTAVATVDSSAASAVLTIADVSGQGVPGHLLHSSGTESLSSPLLASASSLAPGASGSLFGAVSAFPLSLVTYTQPVAQDHVTVRIRQHIGASEPLRTGAYGKALAISLSTTTP